MNIAYLSSARVPDDWAHVLQILKTCDALARAGVTVELVVPYRIGTRKEDPYAFANVGRTFRITRLPCIDLSRTSENPFLYHLRTFSFLFFARLYLAVLPHDLVYTRELLAPTRPERTVFEVHAATKNVLSAVSKLSRARSVVAISNGIREDLVRAGVPEHNVVVAPDAIDLDEFAKPESRSEARKRLGIREDAKVALYIGMLGSWKGTDTLAEAARLLAPEVKVVVIGGEEHELPEWRKRYPEVSFLGFRPYAELADNQQAADVLVLPNTGKDPVSARHTSPLKLFSYMASGIPMVVSDLPSLREVVDEKSAFIVEPDDAAALAAGIRAALADPAEAARRSSAAQSLVAHHTWDARARRILNTLPA